MDGIEEAIGCSGVNSQDNVLWVGNGSGSKKIKWLVQPWLFFTFKSWFGAIVLMYNYSKKADNKNSQNSNLKNPW